MSYRLLSNRGEDSSSSPSSAYAGWLGGDFFYNTTTTEDSRTYDRGGNAATIATLVILIILMVLGSVLCVNFERWRKSQSPIGGAMASDGRTVASLEDGEEEDAENPTGKASTEPPMIVVVVDETE